MLIPVVHMVFGWHRRGNDPRGAIRPEAMSEHFVRVRLARRVLECRVARTGLCRLCGARSDDEVSRDGLLRYVCS